MFDREADHRLREAALQQRIQELETRRRNEPSGPASNFGDVQTPSPRTTRIDDARRAMDCDPNSVRSVEPEPQGDSRPPKEEPGSASAQKRATPDEATTEKKGLVERMEGAHRKRDRRS